MDRDVAKIAYWVDAGYLTAPEVAEALIAPSLAHLPPTLRLAEGLPDYDTPVDVRGTLMDPVVAVAAGRACRPTPPPATPRTA